MVTSLKTSLFCLRDKNFYFDTYTLNLCFSPLIQLWFPLDVSKVGKSEFGSSLGVNREIQIILTVTCVWLQHKNFARDSESDTGTESVKRTSLLLDDSLPTLNLITLTSTWLL